MRNWTSFCVLAVVFVLQTLSAAGQNHPPRLIVRVDDMGFAHAANVATLKTLKEGIATSVEVLVPAPWFPEAVRMLEEHPQVDVGVHLTLTSEWTGLKFRPLTQSPSLTDEDGYFHPFIRPNRNSPGNALLEHDWKLEEIEQEFRAQIELALRRLPRTTHITAHMGCFDMHPDVQALTKKLAKEYKIDIDPADFGLTKVTYQGPKGTSEEKVQSFLAMLRSLKPGQTYFFVDHPGLDTPELRAIQHVGYTNVAVDRQGVTDLLTDKRVKEAIRKLGIKLISYADLLK